ncbi:hypothetical protein ABT063_42760 [Streptomyces sp. NPDC002838]|uniref:hypothetical protein n=1 Tax=Streptomyces sp. NPDC002838 TaxID=3154436 RepID=UPI00332F9B41
MTATALRALPLDVVPEDASELPDRVAALIGKTFLDEAGWDAGQQVLRLPAEHRLLGRPLCRVNDCGKHGVGLLQLCDSCKNRFEASTLAFDAFRVLPRHARNTQQVMCPVEGCGLPQMTAPVKLCRVHHYQRTRCKLALEDFLARLVFLQDRGELSAYMRYRTCRAVRAVLTRMRVLGLTRPGGPGRVKQDLSSLSTEEREQIEHACATVRQSRQTLLGMPRVRPPLPELRPERPR